MTFTHREFEIERRKGTKFRVAKISPIDLMSINTIMDFENFQITRTLMAFCLENVEVLMGDKWFRVKVKDQDVYQPLGIEEDYDALNEIFIWMMANVISQVFTKSSESKEKTK